MKQLKPEEIDFSPTQFMSESVGTVCYIEFNDLAECDSHHRRYTSQLANIKRRSGGQASVVKIQGFYSNGEPTYILKVTLIEASEVEQSADSLGI